MLNVISGLLGNGVAASTTSYESISTVTVGSGGSTSVSFSSIPSTFKHLQIRGLILGNSTISPQTTFNSDTGANYSWHWLFGDGTSAGTYTGTSANNINGNTVFSSTTIGAAYVMDILDYQNTNKYKTTRTLQGFDDNTSHAGYGPLALVSGNWRSTSAVSTVTITCSGGYSFNQYSSFALYGIKG